MVNSESRSLTLPVCLLSLLIAAGGCGSGPAEELPPLATVTGTVTLDGEPLAGANVMFTPQAGGALSSGTTDDQGRYELRYGAAETGAAIGRHKVRISKHGTGSDTTDAVPEKYNAATTLEREVTEGANQLDFELTTDG